MSRYLVSIPSTTALNFDGGVTLPNYTKAIDCMGMYHGMDLSVVQTGTNRTDGDCVHGRVVMAHKFDKASPTLRKAAAQRSKSGHRRNPPGDHGHLVEWHGLDRLPGDHHRQGRPLRGGGDGDPGAIRRDGRAGRDDRVLRSRVRHGDYVGLPRRREQHEPCRPDRDARRGVGNLIGLSGTLPASGGAPAGNPGQANPARDRR